MVVALRNWPDKNDTRWTILYHKLLGVRINDSFRFFTVFRLLPISILIALESQLSKKIVNIPQVVKLPSEWFFAFNGFRTVKSWVWILHAINWFYWLWFLKRRFTYIIGITVFRAWFVVWHFRAYVGFVEVIKVSKLTGLRFMDLTAVILKSAGSFSDSLLLFHWTVGQLLDGF